MGAYGLEERRATLARAKGLAGGRVWQGSVADDYEIPREPGTGRVLPHVILDFGAPVKATRDRNLTNAEAGQPHILPLNAACIAGDADTAQVLANDLFNRVLDWKPSTAADPFEAKGGYGTHRPSTNSTPTRYVEGLFFESVINNGFVAP